MSPTLLRKPLVLILQSLLCLHSPLHAVSSFPEEEPISIEGDIPLSHFEGPPKSMNSEDVLAYEQPSSDNENRGRQETPVGIEKVLCCGLRGLIIMGTQANLTGFYPFPLKEGESIAAVDLEIPGGIQELRNYLNTQFVGQKLNEATFSELKQKIMAYWREKDRPVIAVNIPEQEITDGVLKVSVIEAKLGKVIYKGNRWFSDKALRKYLSVKPGQTINERKLIADVAWMNRNPFRHTNVLLTPGTKEGTSDIELITEDRWPLRFYVGGDNTGTQETGTTRWFAGFNWGNAFNLDHTLSYQATFSANFNKFISHTINYIAPLPWKNQLMLYGGYATVKPKLAHFHSTGKSSQASFRYQVPLQFDYRNKLADATIGLDFKNTNNNLIFVESNIPPLITGQVNIFQFLFEANAGYESKRNKVAFDAQLFWSPGAVLPHQSNKDFAMLNPGAKNEYIYSRALLMDTITFGQGYALYFSLRGQLSSQNLLPSEQFGLGGYDTVRGYAEREVNADNAFCGNLELRTKPFQILSLMGRQKHKDSMIVLVFCDYGWGKDKNKGFALSQVNQLLSVGPGLRYTINPYLSARLDWGFRLHKAGDENSGGNKLHFGFSASY